ncbi:MAG: type II secretion system F family protein [Thermoplasmata archaeon]
MNGDYKLSMFLIGTSFLFLMPYGFFKYREVRKIWRYNVDLVRFLEDLAGYANTGMPMREALLSVAKNRYGAFDPVVRHIESLLYMNVSVDEALRKAFSDTRFRNNRIVSTLLIEANRVGGDMGLTLTQLAESFNAVITAKKQQVASVTSYMTVAVIGFGVFLFTIGLIFQMLFPQFARLSGVNGGIGSIGAGISMSFNMLPQFEFFVFLSVVILGFFTGIVSSALKDNSYYSGFFYGGIFVIISLVMQVLLWGV